MNQNEKMREALQMAVRQNEHDMLLTGEELRQCREALADVNETPKNEHDSGDVLKRAPEIADAHRTLSKWLNEEIDAPIDRQALAKVLAATQEPAVKESLTVEPAALVRLTDEDVERNWQFLHDEEGNPPDQHTFANAIMDAMDRLNRGASQAQPANQEQTLYAAVEFAMSYLQRSGRATREDLEAAHKIRQMLGN